MKYIIITSLILILNFVTFAYADQAVAIDKATGRILMSHDSPNLGIYKGLMEKDIESSNIDLTTIDIKIISDTEFDQIMYDKVIKPDEDKRKIRETVKQAKKDKAKLRLESLGFTTEEIEGLFE